MSGFAPDEIKTDWALVGVIYIIKIFSTNFVP